MQPFFMQPHVEFSPSRYLAAILAIAHGLALFALLAVLPAWAGAASAVLLAASLFHYLLRDAWLKLGASCVGLAIDAEDVVMSLRDGTRLPCTVLESSLVTPMLTVLNLRPHGSRAARNVVILPDSLDAESFRALRVWLKWGERPADGGAARDGDPRGAPPE